MGTSTPSRLPWLAKCPPPPDVSPIKVSLPGNYVVVHVSVLGYQICMSYWHSLQASVAGLNFAVYTRQYNYALFPFGVISPWYCAF